MSNKKARSIIGLTLVCCSLLKAFYHNKKYLRKYFFTIVYAGEIFPAEPYALDKWFIEIRDEQPDVIPYEFSEMFIDGLSRVKR